MGTSVFDFRSRHQNLLIWLSTGTCDKLSKKTEKSGPKWPGFKRNLKKFGKWTCANVLPVSIGLITGGVGLLPALSPLISEITKKLTKKKIIVSQDTGVTGLIQRVITF
ncbi:unnamed protein product, partial [marine sediment metagenome]